MKFCHFWGFTVPVLQPGFAVPWIQPVPMRQPLLQITLWGNFQSSTCRLMRTYEVCTQTSFISLHVQKQQVLVYNMSERWHGVILMMQRLRHTDRSAAGGPGQKAADAYCWQILTSSEARPCVDVLVITMYCALTCGVCQAYSGVWGPTPRHWSGLADWIRLS